MRIKVNPTRQELLELKKRLKRARSGHKLLEDKLESLIRGFLEKIKETKELRSKIEKELPDIFLSFFRSQGFLGKKEIRSFALGFPQAQIELKQKNVFGVMVLEFEIKNKDEILIICLSSLPPSCFLKEIHNKLKDILEDLIRYASLEQEIKAIANEITATRRRVNVLEYVFIPEMERSQKYIYQKLEESERFSRSLLMKLKTYLNS